MKHLVFAAAAAACLLSGAAQAATVTVLPGDAGWANLPDSGSATINADAPRNGNGSIEIVGDRSRFTNGNFFSPASNQGLLSTFTGLSFDWMIAADSTRTDYSPALRLHIWDGAQRSELIYEAAYNLSDLSAGSGANAGTWVSTDFSDKFWRFETGIGPSEPGGALLTQTISQWAANNYSANAYVAAISIGAGSGATAGYHAFVDNVTVARTTGSTTYNFEASAGGAVPEPATWAFMILGFGGIGATLRRQRTAALAA